MKSKSLRKNFAILTMSFGMFVACMAPAYAQQEVSPDWYNPWTPDASAQSAQARTAKTGEAKEQSSQHAKVKRVSASQTAKVHHKNARKPA